MKKSSFILLLIMSMLLSNCNTDKNPLLQNYDTPYGVPPFDKIKTEHYLPAFQVGIKQHQDEIDKIASNKSAPTFENTVAALDYSGELLKKVSYVFFNLYSTDSNEQMEAIAQQITPQLTEHNDNLYLNEALFKRIKTLYEQKDKLGLNPEQNRLLEKYYKNFVRNGAALNAEQKAQLREINKELSLAELQFGQNVLAETNAYQKWITDEKNLAGLPDNVRQAAAEAAEQAGKEGAWLFTLQKASFIPVLQYSENRDLRKELLTAYTYIANNNNQHDNKAVINKIMKLRIQKAQLLGFATPANYYLDDTMAKTPDKVYSFLALLWEPSLQKAKEEAAELQQLMEAEDKGEKLEPWDWWFYAEKLRKIKYDLNEEALRPYFKLENVRQGVFDLASRLYGLQFKKLNNIPVYNPEVEVFEVLDADGSLVGILYTDYFPRAGKQSGAWMNNISEQYIKNGINFRPVICNVGNLTKSTAEHPSLLNMDEVETIFHEFGHALHGLLSQSTYPSLSGTNVARDFVELPSQIMENWCWEPEVLKIYARHYQTNEVIPDDLIEKIQQSRLFNQGFNMTELLAAAYLDMDYHTRKDTSTFKVVDFENASMERIGMIPQIHVRYHSTYFNHIFAGGYCAGYYSYSWAEVLADDAFQAFKETGDVYNQELSFAFRKKILERGDSDEPMKLYIDFRGKEPQPDALLMKRGLK